MMFIALAACVGPRWNASVLLLDPEQNVARAIGDEQPSDGFDPRLVPAVPAPVSLRPCCAFGKDLIMRYVGVPIYFIRNVIAVSELGRHEYDHGMIALQSNGQFVGVEGNGLIYTCRGGWIDTAHVRDNADMTFFLATRILAALPGPLELSFTTNDADVHVRVNVPAALQARSDRFTIAATLSEWLAYRHGAWHELAQWWGYQSVRGYSEQVSAFSPEDFYSNALGVTLGGLAIRQRVFRSREDYNAGIDAWLTAALTLLQALPKEQSRQTMQALDHKWWDSGYALPDNRTVPKRSFDVFGLLTPWLADAPSCAKNTRPRTLQLPTMLDNTPIEAIASIEWRPKSWATGDLLRPGHSVRHDELAHLCEHTHQAMAAVLAPGFDRP